MLLTHRPIQAPADWVCRTCRNLRRGSTRSSRRGIASQTAYRKESQKLPTKPARTRFAPSPTGYLHLGSLRTALFNYLLAKATGGQFLLRIEDTDQKRTVPGAEEQICRDLQWAGLQWDEGPEVGGPRGPYKQSERTSLYQTHARHLLDTGHAYRCFCSAQRLDELARMRNQLGLPTDYDRTCAGISKEESDKRASDHQSHTIRLKVPDTYPQYDDLVYGRVGGARQLGRKLTHAQQSFEDPVLLKSDGLPTYHLANVVDDHLMEITHVVRAVEWMPSTPKHLFMYEAFGWKAPSYAHVGLLFDQHRQKLSKRQHDTGIESFRADGIFPEVLVNFVALLGWSHSARSDKMDLSRLIENFDLKFTKGNTVVNFEKLKYLQRVYAEQFASEVGPHFDEMVKRATMMVEKDPAINLPSNRKSADYVRAILKADAKSYSPLEAFPDRHRSFFTFDPTNDGLQDISKEQGALILHAYRHLLDLKEENWTRDHIHSQLEKALDDAKLTNESEQESNEKKISPSLMKGLRKVVMDSRPGPPIADCLAILGMDTALTRLRRIEQIYSFEHMNK